MDTPEDLMEKARELVLKLQAAGHSPTDIATKLNGRVSSRTIYRWAKGEHAPQQRSDLIALEKLAEGLTA
jgi:transposase|tara:strand:+ start:2564 stop:2773 length:210 start_codon:yes stop_codon:yes gene_type:complete